MCSETECFLTESHLLLLLRNQVNHYDTKYCFTSEHCKTVNLAASSAYHFELNVRPVNIFLIVNLYLPLFNISDHRLEANKLLSYLTNNIIKWRQSV